jgi:hypothetical protein
MLKRFIVVGGLAFLALFFSSASAMNLSIPNVERERLVYERMILKSLGEQAPYLVNRTLEACQNLYLCECRQQPDRMMLALGDSYPIAIRTINSICDQPKVQVLFN